MRENLYEGFLEELTENFRHILYGREEDVIGIHIISYFIGRSSPQWRDRPTSRRTPGSGAERGQQILANIAEIIPLSKQGSLLRAIAHNQAQTVVLGVNQLTTGLFRALERFAQKSFAEAERERLIAERLLPHLPVYEILNTLRLYQDWPGDVLKRIEPAFPAGNSAFVALREDSDARQRYLPLFQQELLRRHGVNVNDFFTDGVFIPDILPTLRPDLAVLLQADLSNTSIDQLLDQVVASAASTTSGDRKSPACSSSPCRFPLAIDHLGRDGRLDLLSACRASPNSPRRCMRSRPTGRWRHLRRRWCVKRNSRPRCRASSAPRAPTTRCATS